MSYKITIEETKSVMKIVGKDWKVIGSKEVEREQRYIHAESTSKTRIEDVYGYTPEVEKMVEQSATVLIQQVDELDMAAVIKAINKLP